MSRVKLEFILLGALLQRPQTGYELQRFMETTGRFLRVNTSMTQVYRSLRSMDDAGWLAHRVEPRQGAQDAKRYSVTEAGAQAFGDWLGEPYEPGRSPGGEEFVVQLRFRAEFLGCEAVIQLLDVELEFWEQHKARYRHRDRTELYSADAPIDVDCVGAILNWEHLRGAALVDAHLAALRELRSVLAAGDWPAPELPNPLVVVPSAVDDPGAGAIS
ncbi:MAG: PadR family transcriptional regulator [Acidimicrobiales bacterium]